jgi:hypothetical protein
MALAVSIAVWNRGYFSMDLIISSGMVSNEPSPSF